VVFFQGVSARPPPVRSSVPTGVGTFLAHGKAGDTLVSVSFVLFAVRAIVPFFVLTGSVAVGTSLLSSAIALFTVGAAITVLTGRSALYSGTRQVLIGLAAPDSRTVSEPSSGFPSLDNMAPSKPPERIFSTRIRCALDERFGRLTTDVTSSTVTRSYSISMRMAIVGIELVAGVQYLHDSVVDPVLREEIVDLLLEYSSRIDVR